MFNVVFVFHWRVLGYILHPTTCHSFCLVSEGKGNDLSHGSSSGLQPPDQLFQQIIDCIQEDAWKFTDEDLAGMSVNMVQITESLSFAFKNPCF